jgi:amino acid adenylation domain-containing protein/non-ribosomal peptide synthase protein (TIGR01720 family)
VEARTEAERRLARVWGEVLGAARVGAEDNFFELGGDSILTLQVVARARREGLGVTARQVFQHQRLADLAAVARLVEAEAADGAQSPLVGEVPLTPVQRWFFEQELEDSHHWNQAVMLAAEREFDAERLERSLAALVRHHDGLRQRYRRGEHGWEQRIEGPDERPTLVCVNLADVPEDDLGRAIERAAAEAQTSLDLEEGPLMRAVLMSLGGGRGCRLLLVIHHLAVDGVSWRILLEDLRDAYEQLEHGETVALPPKTTSLKRWAESLHTEAGRPRLGRELSYWLGPRWEEAAGAVLPVDFDGGVNTEGTRLSVGVGLSEEETGCLLHEVPGAYRTRVDEVLLAALAKAVAPRTRQKKVLVDLEGHGREELDEALDVTRTVGWFTTIYPVLLEFDTEAGDGTLLKSIKEQLRKAPRRGIGYGILRYLSPDENVRESLSRMPRAELSFNYLGQMDQLLGKLEDGKGSAGRLRLATESAGPARSPRAKRRYLIDVTAGVTAGRLWVRWDYCEQAHSQETVRSLGDAFINSLRQLIAHCRSAEAGGFTPSDFPLVEVSEEELARLTAQHPDLEDIYPLSPLQHGLLFHSLSAPSSGLYFNQLGCRLDGALDPDAFARAWRLVLSRHTALRASFAWEGLARPLQLIHPDPALELRREDWSSLNAEERDRRWLSLLEDERRRGFDPQRPPLMRLALVSEGEGRNRFLWCYHHALLDGWSAAVVIEEVLAAYAAEARGERAMLGAARPYGEYLAWLRAQDAGAAAAYWRRTLAGAGEAAGGARRRAVGGRGGRHGEVVRGLGVEVTAGLRRLGRTAGLTLGTMVSGAWALVLGRGARSRRVVFGTTSSGRPADLPGAERMVGLFINTLPVVAELEEGAGVAAWLRRLQDEAAERRQYEYSALWEVAGWGGAARGAGLFETLVVYENYPEVAGPARGGVGGVGVSGVETAERTNYGLTLVGGESGGELVVRAAYDGEAYGEGEAGRALGRVVRVLEELSVMSAMGAEEAERVKVGEIEWLPSHELRQVLEDWPANRQAYPQQLCLHELFEEQVNRSPSAVAVVFGEDELTYAELNRRANRLARSLRRLGVGPESRVGLCAERSAEMVVALLAILKTGGAYVPLDAAYPAGRLSFMLEDAGVTILLTQRRLLEKLPAPEARVLLLDSDTSEAAGEGDENLDAVAHPLNLAYVIYTSGSTGRPKGVAIEHHSAVTLVRWARTVFPAEALAGVLASTSICFDLSVYELFLPLACGGRVILVRNALELPALGEAAGVTLLNTVPSAAAELVRGGGIPRTVRTVNLAGEPLPRELAEQLYELGCVEAVYNLYGPSEDTTYSTYELVGRAEAGAPSIGRPIAGTQAYVLDERMRPLPPGVCGELYLGGDGLARGYLGRPALTAELFVPHPFGTEPGARLYRTGDLARWSHDGELEFAGRADTQVKVRGYRVETGEVESVLREHAEVRDAAVVAREEEGGGKRLVAYVVGRAGAPPPADELRSHLRRRLPDYMVPAVFMPLDELPLTPNGKVDRRALPEPGQAADDRPEGGFRRPRNPLEEVVAQVWAQALGGARVGLDDNFFDLGGHSLLAMQVISRLSQALGVELSLEQFFAAETLAALAATVEASRRGAEGSTVPPLVRAPREGALPLSFAQQRMWFVEQLEAEHTLYNIHVAARLAGRLDVPALERSLDALLERHEILRTSFVAVDGEPRQVVAPRAGLPLPVIDLRGREEAEREAEFRRISSDESRRPFDLTSGLLLRARLLRLGESEHVLLLTTHHIASDAWSMNILLADLAALYEAFTQGRPSPLEELPLQYADYAHWQRSWLRGDTLEAHISYWRRKLGGALPTLELPADRPRPQEPTYRGATRTALLPADLTRSLRELSRGEGATLFMTLLAAFQTLLHRYTGQEDIIVGSSIASRPRVELERLIGCFINTLGLRTDLSGDPTFRELLARVREVTLGAYAHQDLPFEQVVEAVRPERALNRAPLFRAWFSLLNTPPAQARALPGLELGAVEGENSTAQFDVTLIVWETSETLHASLTYSTDLFEETTGARVLEHLLRLLESVAARPGARLSALEFQSEDEKVQRNLEHKEKEESKRKRLTSLKPKPVSFSQKNLVSTRDLSPGRALPLVVEPASETDLARWAEGNPDFIRGVLRERGGVLFRGFSLTAVSDFKRFVDAAVPDLLEYRERSTPRTEVGDHIYTSTEYPPDQPIALHNEFSYARSWPMKICFFCHEGEMEGGETPIADSRRVFQLLDPRTREHFAGRKVMYVRNYGSGIDLDWQTAFQTDDRRQVEEYCRRAPIEFEWKDGDVLKTWQVRDAVARHPQTGEEVWFNQAHLFHISNLDWDVRQSLSSAFGREDLPRNAYYGDGSPIEDSVLDEVRAAYREAEVVFPWQRGDVLLLDNMLVAHGRRPYKGVRKILVGMGEPHSLDAEGAAAETTTRTHPVG